VGKEDEALPQLTVHTLEKVSAKTFGRKLAQGEKFQNGVTIAMSRSHKLITLA